MDIIHVHKKSKMNVVFMKKKNSSDILRLYW